MIVFAGGTSVTGALECPSTEKRMIISLDTSQMVCRWIYSEHRTHPGPIRLLAVQRTWTQFFSNFFVASYVVRVWVSCLSVLCFCMSIGSLLLLLFKLIVLLVCVIFCYRSSAVSTGASDCLERLVSKMTSSVSSRGRPEPDFSVSASTETGTAYVHRNGNRSQKPKVKV